MVWSRAQVLRLYVEKDTLEKYFPGRVTWIEPTENAKVEVRLTSNSNKAYTLRVDLPADFPNSRPKLMIVSPSNLLQKNRLPIPDSDWKFHTLEKRDGLLAICHFYSPDWTAENTVYQVFMKGRLWIEAYEAHLRTGKTLDVFLGHQEYTYDLQKPWIPDEGALEAIASVMPPADPNSQPSPSSDSRPSRRSVFKMLSKKKKNKL